MRFTQAFTAPSSTKSTVIAAFIAALVGVFFFAATPLVAPIAVAAIITNEWAKTRTLDIHSLSIPMHSLYWLGAAAVVAVAVVGAPIAAVATVSVATLAWAAVVGTGSAVVTEFIGGICKS